MANGFLLEGPGGAVQLLAAASAAWRRKVAAVLVFGRGVCVYFAAAREERRKV